MVPVIHARGLAKTPPSEWESATQIAELIANIRGKRTDLRQNGGFVVDVCARDRYRAVEVTRDLVNRWDARAELAAGSRIVYAAEAWVQGFADSVPLAPRVSRQVNIGALSRQNKIYASPSPDETSLRIDDALQLVQPMEAGPRAAAISGGWASIESLLTESGESESLASLRLASIIACSFPRAELTALAFTHRRAATDSLAVALKAAPGNLQRARLTADALSCGHTLAGKGEVVPKN